jgi:hypothetical protein
MMRSLKRKKWIAQGAFLDHNVRPQWLITLVDRRLNATVHTHCLALVLGELRPP